MSGSFKSKRKKSQEISALSAINLPKGSILPSGKESTKDVQKEHEDLVYEESLSVIEGVQLFWAVKPEEMQLTQAPPHWVDRYGSQAVANKMFALAKTGYLNKQEAPIGVHISMEVAKAVLKKKSADKAPEVSRLLIGNAVEMLPVQTIYPTREVFEDDD